MNWNKIASNGIYKGRFNTPSPVKQEPVFSPKVIIWKSQVKSITMGDLESQLRNELTKFTKKKVA
jgi:hypothetical protein